MFDEKLARDCPRPTNLGAWLFLVLGLGTLVTVGASLATPTRGLVLFEQCSTPAAPNPMPGALCGTLAALVGLLPVWALLPPTRPAVQQSETQLVWDRPAWPTAVRVCGTMLLLLLLGSSVSALQDTKTSWSPEAGGDCSIAPAAIQHQLEERRGLLLLWTLAAGLGTLVMASWGPSERRPSGRIRLDELGLALDGERWSYKDIESAEVAEGLLRFGRYDGAHYQVRLFRGEHAFAQVLVRTLEARLPAQVEDRSEAKAALSNLAENS